MALMMTSDPKIRLSTRVIDYALRPEALRSLKHLKSPPKSPKEIRRGPLMSITYLELVLILPIKFHPHLSTLSVFQDFQFPRFLLPPSITNFPRSDNN